MISKDKITKDTLDATKKKDMKRIKTLRFLQASIKNKEIELRPNLIKDSDVLSVLKKQIKQVEESLENYKKISGYEKQVEEETYQLELLKSYLSKPIPTDQIKIYIEEAISVLKAQSIKDMGSVMKFVMEKTNGVVDGKELSALVKDRLQNL